MIVENIHPFELSERWNALHGQMAGLQDLVLRHVFRKEEFRSWNGEEGILDDLEHGIADRFWPVDSSVKVPSAQIQFLSNLV